MASTTTSDPTAEEIAAAREVLERAQAAQARRDAASAAERAERLAPTAELTRSAAYREVMERARAIEPTIREFVDVHPHLAAIVSIGQRLADVLPQARAAEASA